MSHTIYAAKFEQTIIHQHIHLRRESQSHAPAHVRMRLYPIDKSLVCFQRERRTYVRIAFKACFKHAHTDKCKSAHIESLYTNIDSDSVSNVNIPIICYSKLPPTKYRIRHEHFAHFFCIPRPLFLNRKLCTEF